MRQNSQMNSRDNIIANEIKSCTNDLVLPGLAGLYLVHHFFVTAYCNQYVCIT